MFRSLLVAAVTGAAAIGAGAAHAGGVSWSIGIGAPGVTTVLWNAPAYAPIYHHPQPVHRAVPVYAVPTYVPAPLYISDPVPVYRRGPTRHYHPRHAGRYRGAPVVIVRPGDRGRGWGHGHGHGHDPWRD